MYCLTLYLLVVVSEVLLDKSDVAELHRLCYLSLTLWCSLDFAQEAF